MIHFQVSHTDLIEKLIELLATMTNRMENNYNKHTSGAL